LPKEFVETFGRSSTKVGSKTRRISKIVPEETKLPPVVIKGKSQLGAYQRRSDAQAAIPLIGPFSTKNVIRETEDQERAIELFIRKKRRLRETIEQRTHNLVEFES